MSGLMFKWSMEEMDDSPADGYIDRREERITALDRTIETLTDVRRMLRKEIRDHRFAVAALEHPIKDPVHSEDDKWYFWDETWGDRHGPYVAEEDARYELARYSKFLDDGISWNGR